MCFGYWLELIGGFLFLGGCGGICYYRNFCGDFYAFCWLFRGPS